MTFSSLEKAKGFRETETDTYMSREKTVKMADGIETGMYPSERLSAWEEEGNTVTAHQLPLWTSLPFQGHPEDGHPGFQNTTFINTRSQ